MQARISERLHLVTDLRHAIDSGEFEVAYQPFVELATERMVGVEALVRWKHPERGLLQPGAFIGAAEESGLIVALGDHVLRQAGAAARRWSSEDSGFELLSVNLSPRQFADEHLVDSIDSILAETSLAPELLVLEITENVLIGDMLATREKLDALRAMGVRIAIDDFGTGYSSLAYLMQLSVQTVKIDRAFMAQIPTEARAERIVTAIIAMAQALGLTLTAEGIETPEQHRFLLEAGCELGQGFGFAKPQDAKAIERYLN
jgi:EAL domain-containing protein (putative c-di-GMP-specific phosphodiesterase class I)